jgi:hypothetical protein
VLCQFGADDALLKNSSELRTTKEAVDIEFNLYGLVSLASLLGQLPSKYLYFNVISNHSLPMNVYFHTILLLLKMGIDVNVGNELCDTVEASLSGLLLLLDHSGKADLIALLVKNIPELSIRSRLLHCLPIQPLPAAIFRQSLAKAFLDVDPTATLSSLLSCLKSNSPFTKIKRDLSNEDSRAIKHAIEILDIAISKPPREQRDITEKIKLLLQDMHRRIIDGGAAFMVRTETKEVIHRVILRLDEIVHGAQRNRMESLDKFM